MSRKEILSFDLISEPDLQQYAGFVIEATKALGGNEFILCSRLTGQLETLREECMKGGKLIKATLMLENKMLVTEFSGKAMVMDELSAEPKTDLVEAVSKNLRAASESADTDLLSIRNRRITEELDKANRRAEEEMSRLELMLRKKKIELDESIHLAETDSLTGILNRGAFDIRLRQAMSLCARQGYPLCLVMVDLDDFKRINDTHGHQRGDEYLIHAARVLSGSAREESDYVCRVGGDEFGLIINAGEKIARLISEKALKSFDKKMSIGVTGMTKGDTVKSLVGRADAALYKAKELGKGRVVVLGRDDAAGSEV